jgi:predicted nucleic acid-binding protein
MPDFVISNTSPVFYLHRLRSLDLLRKLYQRIIVPEAVVDELKAGRDQGEDVPEVAEYDWIEVRSVRVPELIRLITDLGAGEAQVLALALEEPGSLVILDDRLARQIAKLQNIRMTGTAGVILKAKQEGYVSAVAPLLEKLLQLNFRLSETAKASILKLAQEEES